MDKEDLATTTETPKGKEFESFNLSPQLLNSLQNIGFQKASPIQELTIQPILEGKDIFAQAETGSGKTGSFAIPLIEKLLRLGLEKITSSKDIFYIVLSPTRELAQQTHKTFEDLSKSLGIKSDCLIGGENIDRQKELLKENPHILVATPGRLCDLMKQKSADLGRCEAVVFDEADRLFDMGFKKEIEFILSKIPNSRQLIMVSATSNMDVLRTAYKYNSMPVELKLNADDLLVDNIDHKMAMVTRDEKMPLLVKYLRDYDQAYALVFCNTQIQTHLVAEWLKLMNFKAEPISGALAQNKRTKLMERFRSRDITILVCTDVAARGLDIKDVNLVVNYDLPQEAANYVHRIGRTGRAGKSGEAISFCAHEDCENLDAIYEYIKDKIPKVDLTDEDFAKDVVKKPFLDHKSLRIVERNKPSSKQENKGRKKAPEKNHNKTSKKLGDSTMKKTDRDINSSFEEKPAKEVNIKTYPFVNSEKTGDSRDFYYTSSSLEKLKEAAMGYFGVNDETILDIEVLKKGLPKFLFFGPRKTSYRVCLKPIYKKILLPYLINIIKLSKLRLFAKVSFKNNNIRVILEGSDENLLYRNRAELFRSFEQIIRTYLNRRIRVPKEVSLEVYRTQGSAPRSRASNRERRDNGNSEAQLVSMINEVKQKVIESNGPVLLEPLNSHERRIVHQIISEDAQFVTESKGEGRLKRIEISLS